MKRTITIILIAILAVGAYFGYSIMRERSLLASGKNLLLVNKKEQVYTFSEFVDLDDITIKLKVIDAVENLSEEEISKHTADKTLFGDQGLPEVVDSVIELPEGQALASWNEVLNQVPEAMKQMCNDIERNDFAHDCLMRHVIWLVATEQVSLDACDQLFPSHFIEECKDISANKQFGVITDTDGNNLIDMYEYYANPDLLEIEPNLST